MSIDYCQNFHVFMIEFWLVLSLLVANIFKLSYDILNMIDIRNLQYGNDKYYRKCQIHYAIIELWITIMCLLSSKHIICIEIVLFLVIIKILNNFGMYNVNLTKVLFSAQVENDFQRWNCSYTVKMIHTWSINHLTTFLNFWFRELFSICVGRMKYVSAILRWRKGLCTKLNIYGKSSLINNP